jgi:16S rRNA G966 N2-methylase RsmD
MTDQKPNENQKRAKIIHEEVHQAREEMKRMSEGKSRTPKTRKKKAPEDPICEACRTRNHGHVPDHACAWCKEEQEKKGRRAWTTSLQLGTVHCGDMKELGLQVPDESVDLMFTDPPYILELWENAYAELAMLAARVLKPGGFLFTYAPQAHLADIMDLLRHTTPNGEGLKFFWIIASLNSGPALKAHKWNALCLHKPILIFQKGETVKGARRCFADVVRGKKQKRFHAWQQSVHDVLGIIGRFMVPGEILLDPFAGWGTSLIAANLLGMEWVGFEIEPDRQRIAMQRLQQRPIALEAFGIEAGEAPEAREPVPEQKDTSKQGKFHEYEKALKETRELCDSLETPTTEAPQEEDPLDPRCKGCHNFEDCKTHDPRAGCLDTVKAIQEAQKDRDQKETRCCDTCKGGKNPGVINMDCPDYSDVSNGTIDQEQLRASTRRLGCTFWMAPGSPEKIPNVWGYCVGKRGCTSISTEDGICSKTGQKVKDMTYCPTQHLVGNQPEKKPKKGSPEWLAELTKSKRARNIGWLWEVWAVDPKKGEWLFTGAHTEEEANAERDRLQSEPDRAEKGITFKVGKRPLEVCSMGEHCNAENRKACEASRKVPHTCICPVPEIPEKKKSASKKSKKQEE